MLVGSIVGIIARATVKGRNWAIFKQIVLETKIIVEKEGNRVLTHECYYDPETFKCLTIEVYVNEEAFLNHLQLVRTLSEKYKMD